MAMNLNRNEQMTLNMFGCGKLQRSIGNLYGTTALATSRKAMRMQNQLVDISCTFAYLQKHDGSPSSLPEDDG